MILCKSAWLLQHWRKLTDVDSIERARRYPRTRPARSSRAGEVGPDFMLFW